MRGRVGARLLTAAAVLAVGGAAPASAEAPHVVVSGRIQQRPDGTPIAGAAVNIVGFGGVVSGSDGFFWIANVPPGRQKLLVQAMAYGSREMELFLRADTTLTVLLDIDPIPLAALRTRAFVSVSGRVVDGGSGRPVPDAQVAVGPDHRDATDLAGRFALERLPAAQALPLEVRALGYSPVFVALLPGTDTTVVFALNVDSVGLRMIEEQVTRIDVRSQETGYARVAIDRRTLLRQPAWTAADVLRERLGNRIAIVCLFIDEVRVTGGDGLDILQSYLADELERLEIIHRGRMVRVYTRRFIEKLIRENIVLEPIRYVEGLPPVVCS